MKSIIISLCNKALGKNLYIDDKIPFTFLLCTIIERIIMLARGLTKKVRFARCGKRFFCGRNVRISVSRKICAGNNLTLKNRVRIDALSENGVAFGNNVSIGENTHIMCSGSIQQVGKGINIGNEVGIANDCFFGAAGGITIGNEVIIGQNVRFHAENHEFNDLYIPIKNQGVNHKGIVVGDNCWIGAGAVFLDGVELGNGCVVGANSVVTKSFPENSVIVGNPAKLLRVRGKKGMALNE